MSHIVCISSSFPKRKDTKPRCRPMESSSECTSQSHWFQLNRITYPSSTATSGYSASLFVSLESGLFWVHGRPFSDSVLNTKLTAGLDIMTLVDGPRRVKATWNAASSARGKYSGTCDRPYAIVAQSIYPWAVSYGCTANRNVLRELEILLSSRLQPYNSPGLQPRICTSLALEVFHLRLNLSWWRWVWCQAIPSFHSIYPARCLFPNLRCKISRFISI